MAYLTDLEAGLVEREAFGRRRWFSAHRWYYHRPGVAGRSSGDGAFYRRVDRELREICVMLHRSGVVTLPSCQGHFHSRRYFARVWEELEGEARQIAGEGLGVVDSETQRPAIFRCPGYRLPWRGFGAFWEAVEVRQHQGYLGLGLGVESEGLIGELDRHPLGDGGAKLSVEQVSDCGWVAGVFVDSRTPEERRRLWERVGRYLRMALRRPKGLA